MATAIPSNHATFTVDEVARATGAETTFRCADACTGVITDSRGDVAGKLFVALSGETFDGHRFVADVLARGAWGAVIQRDVPQVSSNRIFRVESSLSALGGLAKAHRIRWGGRVVTIGGSAGKTTTRVATAALLEELHPGQIHHTLGNLNNLVGVPMTLLGLESQHQVAVVEVGTNQRGEVAQLASICQADVAVLTCIGLEHTAGLGDLDGVEAEERELFSSMRAPAQLIGCRDDARVWRLLSTSSDARVWSFGVHPEATHRIVERTSIDLLRTRLRLVRKFGGALDDVRLSIRLLGLPGALASIAAIAVADALFGLIDGKSLELALDRDLGEAGRLKIVERADRALVIDDCYNANPISMRSSIHVARELAAARSSRLCLVLGDMLELGEFSHREHDALVSELERTDTVVAVGEEMTALVERASQQGFEIPHFATSEQAAPYVREAARAGDIILVKGSRGVRLERVVDAVTGGEGISP